MSCTIESTRGIKILVDADDYERMNQFKWYVGFSRNNIKGRLGYAYRQERVGGKHRSIMMHRELLNYPSLNIDHVNGDIHDNRKENLRLCTQSGNIANSKLSKANKCGFKGVRHFKPKNSPNGLRKPWSAQIMVDYKYLHLGYYATAEEAAKAYDKAAGQNFGEFARLNFPQEIR